MLILIQRQHLLRRKFFSRKKNIFQYLGQHIIQLFQ